MKKGALIVSVLVVMIIGAFLVLNYYGLTGFVTIPGPDVGKCTDSDLGENWYLKGTATYTNRNAQYTDYCYARSYGPEKWLKEYYCTHGDYRVSTREHLCENGCVNGACIK